MPVTSKHIQFKEPKLTFKKNAYPVVSDHLPKPYFVGLWVGSRQSGKTYNTVKHIKAYEESNIINPKYNKRMECKTYIISPTYDANPVFSSLSSVHPRDVYTSYSDETLAMILNDVQEQRAETEEYNKKLEVWKKYMKSQDLEDLEEEELMMLEEMSFMEPHPCRYPGGAYNFLILDDLVGSGAFKNGRSFLTNTVLKNRHLGINICILTQSIRSIPKPIRANTSVFVLFKYANQKIVLEDIYEEVSGKATQEQFLQLFDYATEGEHNPLVLDFTGNKNEVFKKGFSELLYLV